MHEQKYCQKLFVMLTGTNNFKFIKCAIVANAISLNI